MLLLLLLLHLLTPRLGMVGFLSTRQNEIVETLRFRLATTPSTLQSETILQVPPYSFLQLLCSSSSSLGSIGLLVSTFSKPFDWARVLEPLPPAWSTHSSVWWNTKLQVRTGRLFSPFVFQPVCFVASASSLKFATLKHEIERVRECERIETHGAARQKILAIQSTDVDFVARHGYWDMDRGEIMIAPSFHPSCNLDYSTLERPSTTRNAYTRPMRDMTSHHHQIFFYSSSSATTTPLSLSL